MTSTSPEGSPTVPPGPEPLARETGVVVGDEFDLGHERAHGVVMVAEHSCPWFGRAGCELAKRCGGSGGMQGVRSVDHRGAGEIGSARPLAGQFDFAGRPVREANLAGVQEHVGLDQLEEQELEQRLLAAKCLRQPFHRASSCPIGRGPCSVRTHERELVLARCTQPVSV